MLISHRYKFIYLKTEKTASSSLNNIFKQIITEKDELLPADPAVRRRVLQEDGGLAGRSFAGSGRATRRLLPALFGLHRHAFARDVRAFIGADLFDSYTIITSERNPWDRQVSLFSHRVNKHPARKAVEFQNSMRSPLYNLFHHNRLHNWDVYAVDGKVCADHVIRFENLEADFREALRLLGLPVDRYTLPKARIGKRPKGLLYQDYYSDDVRALVARWYRKEIDYFGYTF